MKTSELIKQAEELLSKCPPAPFEVQAMADVEECYGECIGIMTPANKAYDSITLYVGFCLDEFDVKCLGDFLAFARNHMQELVDRLKRYEAALVEIEDGLTIEDEEDKLEVIARAALEEE